jgi:Leucine-rich repeat (LRR) protein
MKASLLYVFLVFACCPRAVAATPEEELSTYAARVGARWHPDGMLVGGKNGLDFQQLRSLSLQALDLIRTIVVARQPATPEAILETVPNLNFLPSLQKLQLMGIGVERADGVRGLKIKILDLSGNPLTDIPFLGSLRNIEVVGLNGTKIIGLPDLSNLDKLKSLSVAATPINSLANIETVQSDFDLDVWGCDSLIDIDALRLARVDNLTIDEDNFERLRSWFDKHMNDIKSRRPQFKVQFQLLSGE